MYNVIIYNGEEMIDFIQLKNYKREEAFKYLNRIWTNDERNGRYYEYVLMDSDENIIFRNHR